MAPKKKDKPTDVVIDTFPGSLETVSHRKSTSEFVVTFTVDPVHLDYLKPLMPKINNFFVIAATKVETAAQAQAILDRVGKPKDDPIVIEETPGAIGGECTLDELAELLNMTSRNVNLLENKDVIVKLTRGRYDIQKSVQGYIKYLKDLAEGQGEAGLTDERLKAARETTRAKARENDQAEGKLVDAHEMQSTLEEFIANLKSKLSAFKVKAVPYLKKHLRRTARLGDVYITLEEFELEYLDELQRFEESVIYPKGVRKNVKAAKPAKPKQVRGRKTDNK